MAKKKKGAATSPSAAGASSTSTASNDPAIQVEVIDEVLRADFYTLDDYTKKELVGAIDQGTSSTRFLLFTTSGRIAASAQMEHEQIYPQPGWHEHDPVVLWQNTVACITAVSKALKDKKDNPIELDTKTLAAIGITNQRETTIAWNKETGKPYYNAIVWDDTRTQDIAESIINNNSDDDTLKVKTGLPVSSYFAGTKIKWLLDNVDELRNDIIEKPDQVCFGTVDAWLLYQLTGNVPKSKKTGKKLKGAAGAINTGGSFLTDVTNASRWLFMDLKTCQWDEECIDIVCAPHKLPIVTLPKICPSSYQFGVVNDCGLPSLMKGVPLASVLGDQQAALFGQAAHNPGQAKNTYGTGLFLMMNTGSIPVPSTHGLLTTVAYQLGENSPVQYALEGSVSHSGSTIQWLRDQLNIINKASESEELARTTTSNDGLYLVPAFAGLFAPHWRSDARACIVGMTTSHHKGHICRAALEAAAYQTKEVFDAILKDIKNIDDVELTQLKVDGGGTNNNLLMQFQADIINVPVIKPLVMETTSIGAAFAAGLCVGVWKDLEEIEKLWTKAKIYKPYMSDEIRTKNLSGWNKAITKSLGWHGHEGEALADISEHNKNNSKHQSVVETTTTIEEEKKEQAEVSSSEGKADEVADTTIDLAAHEKQVDAAELNDEDVTTNVEEQEVVPKADEVVPKVDEVPVPKVEDVKTKLINNDEKVLEQAIYVGEVDEIAPRKSRELPFDNKKVKDFNPAVVAMTAITSLCVGVLLGSKRR